MDNNVIFRIFALLDPGNKDHIETFNLLIKFLTTYDPNILDTVKLFCLIQIADNLVL